MGNTKKAAEEAATAHEKKYKAALEEFGKAVELLQKGSFKEARDRFQTIEKENTDEPSLADRSRTYAKICEQKLAPAPESPQDGEGLYLLGVMSSNNGQYDEALDLLERALQQMPDSPKVLYARASTWSLKGNAEAAVAELRRAISVDPRVRFQATNDPDFEPIREEPAFIDIIEPTPSGS
jgi:tetratricopeptide (TPR) repeat protein